MKLLIADYADVLVDEVFVNFSSYGGAVIVTALFFYSIQIYADFAGGINIAIGIAEILGIRLTENFRQPFFATSVSDFWRRWHITLGTWLKDYLFFPVAISKPFIRLGRRTRKLFGARFGKLIPTMLATMVVYGVVGIWHGSSLKYAAFGIYSGGIISLSLLCEPFIAKLRSRTGIDAGAGGFGRIFAIVRTLMLLLFSRFFARSTSLMTALRMIKRTFLHFNLSQIFDGTLLRLGLSGGEYVLLGISVAVLLAYDVSAEMGKPPLERINGQKAPVQFAVLFIMLAALVMFGVFREGYVASEFIYAQF